jgi:hypothetical protein
MNRRMRSKLVAAGLAALLLGGVGCDDGPPPRPAAQPPPAWTLELDREAESLAGRLAATDADGRDGVRVQLVFGAQADLDLYVTDPREETVYYANTPTQTGGELAEDRRCGHETPRVETVRFPEPLVSGRYRVGVDYPRECDDAKAPVPFVVAVDGPGGRTTQRGLARHRVFEPIVLELEIEAASGARAEGEVSP